MKVPAVCDNCGTLFASGFEFIDCTNITLGRCEAGPCPGCGGTGHTPAGKFNFLGDAIKIISASNKSIAELRRFEKLLGELRKAKAAHNHIASKIRRDAPKFAGIAKLLPQDRSEVLTFIQILQGCILIALAAHAEMRSTQPGTIVNQTTIDQTTTINHAKTPAVKVSRPGVNEPCHCGSGKKYKHCCLRGDEGGTGKASATR